MAASQDVRTDRIPMSWEDYWATGEAVRGEYAQGCLMMTPGPDFGHQVACRRLANALEEVLPQGYFATEAWNWTPATGRNFIPDVMVHATPSDPIRFTGVPELIVEVLSRNRADDLIEKMAAYAAFGLPRYWIVDRDRAAIEDYRLDSGRFALAATVGEQPVEVDFGIARITLRVPDLLDH